jgi:hypothetical protein
MFFPNWSVLQKLKLESYVFLKVGLRKLTGKHLLRGICEHESQQMLARSSDKLDLAGLNVRKVSTS